MRISPNEFLVAYTALFQTAQDVFNVDLVISYRDNPDYARLVDYAQRYTEQTVVWLFLPRQESFECCGVTAQKYRDWNHNIYFNCSNTNPSTERCSVPASCCRPLKREDSDPDTRLKRRFCGQGVLAMTEQDAWHKIFTRSCVDASVTYVQSNAIAMMGTGIVVFAVLSLLRTMASTVHEEIISLEHLYEHYYKSMARGYKKSLARQSRARFNRPSEVFREAQACCSSSQGASRSWPERGHRSSAIIKGLTGGVCHATRAADQHSSRDQQCNLNGSAVQSRGIWQRWPQRAQALSAVAPAPVTHIGGWSD
ncbi:hypothetical protein HPB48_016379 [Haemaphysalis longicornis]|uniref:Tetraspanin n=1 Tax=Haemaphysalis longicornis TaxID=44386 RepID=A0A9J6GLL7_HAELO|nr:hypothetical protein HPB48_016379 [Haemaphysalis longicornis]